MPLLPGTLRQRKTSPLTTLKALSVARSPPTGRPQYTRKRTSPTAWLFGSVRPRA